MQFLTCFQLIPTTNQHHHGDFGSTGVAALDHCTATVTVELGRRQHPCPTLGIKGTQGGRRKKGTSILTCDGCYCYSIQKNQGIEKPEAKNAGRRVPLPGMGFEPMCAIAHWILSPTP